MGQKVLVVGKTGLAKDQENLGPGGGTSLVEENRRASDIHKVENPEGYAVRNVG